MAMIQSREINLILKYCPFGALAQPMQLTFHNGASLSFVTSGLKKSPRQKFSYPVSVTLSVIKGSVGNLLDR